MMNFRPTHSAQIVRLKQAFRALATVFVLLAGSLGCRATIYNVKNYGAQGNGVTNDQQAIQATINAAIAGGAGNEVYIPAGNYNLGSDSDGSGEEIDLFRSNNLTIQGDTATVLLNPSTDRDFFYLWLNSGLSIKSLTLQRTTRMFSQMTVTAEDTVADNVTVTVQKGYDQLDATNISSTALLLVFSDPSSGSWGDHLPDCGFFAPGDHSVCWPPTVISRTRISPTQWVLKLNTQPQANYIGAQAVLWVTSGGGHAFVATASQNVLIQDTAYYAAGADAGFYLAGNTGPFTFRNFTMDVTPGSNDLVAAAGGSYTLNNHTALTISSSRIVGVWDDAVNVGANYARVYDQVDSQTIDVDGSRGNFTVGDTISVWDWTYQKEHERSRAIATQVNCSSTPSGSSCRIHLDRSVAIVNTGYLNSAVSPEKDGIDRIIDIQSAGSLTVTGSTFQSFHSHGILSRPSNTTITNNTFLNIVSPAIQAGADFVAEEGPAATNITIKQNLFQNVSSSNILIGSFSTLLPSTIEMDIAGVSIINNSFVGFGKYSQGIYGNNRAPIYLRNVLSSLISGNTYSSFDPTVQTVANGVDYALSSTPYIYNNVHIPTGQ